MDHLFQFPLPVIQFLLEMEELVLPEAELEIIVLVPQHPEKVKILLFLDILQKVVVREDRVILDLLVLVDVGVVEMEDMVNQDLQQHNQHKHQHQILFSMVMLVVILQEETIKILLVVEEVAQEHPEL